MMPDGLMDTEEVARLLGVAPDSVRVVMRRHGIRRIHGWPRDQVEALVAAGYGQGKGRRTDVHRPS